MSDEVTAAIQESIAGLEGSESSPDTSELESTAAPAADATTDPTSAPSDPSSTTAPPAPGTPPVALDEKPKRRGPVPLDRHEAALESARSEARAERDHALQQLRQEHDQQLAEARTKLQLLDIADKEPERFLAALKQADPRYAELLARAQAQAEHHNGNGTAGPRPGPDRRFDDGSLGYSDERLDALMEWNAKRAEERAEQRILERFKPIEDAHLADQQIRQSIGRVRVQVETAVRDWPGFAENQVEIAAALGTNRTWQLADAYRHVVLGKAHKDTALREQEIRAKVIAEMNAKPKRVTGTSPSGSAPPAASSDDLESIIKASIANLPR
jgi:hypothetical protein